MKQVLLAGIILFSISCKKDIAKEVTTASITNSSTDAAVTIPSVVIGSQTWMQQNLAVTKYRNGDAIAYIPYAAGNNAWSDATGGAWCYYNNDPATAATYGLLYNAYAIIDPRGLAPKGWHIPATKEWDTLATFLGGSNVAGGKMKAISALWTPPNTGATNSSGFTGLPGGIRSAYGSGPFDEINKGGYWWAIKPTVSGNTYYVKRLLYNYKGLYSLIYDMHFGASVRCVKN